MNEKKREQPILFDGSPADDDKALRKSQRRLERAEMMTEERCDGLALLYWNRETLDKVIKSRRAKAEKWAEARAAELESETQLSEVEYDTAINNLTAAYMESDLKIFFVGVKSKRLESEIYQIRQSEHGGGRE